MADAAVIAAVDERRAVAREGEPAGLGLLVLFRQVKLYRDNGMRSSADQEDNSWSPQLAKENIRSVGKDGG